ncbi:MAG TPA: DUF222 domain-containing protein [Actinomycetes bacterium]|nr:DUF222 domain-containing protein [Actinomycetes bacterium]
MGKSEPDNDSERESSDGAEPSPGWATPGVPVRPGGVDRFLAGDLLTEVGLITTRFLADAKDLAMGEQLVACRRTIDQLEAAWLSACGVYDEAGCTTDDGAPSLAAWLRAKCQLAPGEATGRAKVVSAITGGDLTVTGDRLLAGEFSWRHAAVIAATVADAPAGDREAAERALQEPARTLDPSLLRRVGVELLHRLDVDKAEERAVRRWERRGLTFAETFDGMVSVSGLLDPVSGSVIQTALDAKLRPPRTTHHGDGHDHGDSRDQSDSSDHKVGSGGSDHSGTSDHSDGSDHRVGRDGSGLVADEGELRSWPQRRADALTDICREWGELGPTPTVAGQRPHVTVIVDHATLNQPPATTDDRKRLGQNGSTRQGSTRQGSGVGRPAQLSWVGPITPNETEFLSCDSVVSRVIMGPDGAILDVGRATRTIPPAIRTAVTARDRTCIADGCYRPPEHCDIHHIIFWEHGGTTSLNNLAMVCRFHHRTIHHKGWTIQQTTTGKPTLTPPTGRHPPPRRL